MARQRIMVEGEDSVELGPVALGERRFGQGQHLCLFDPYVGQVEVDIALQRLLEGCPPRRPNHFEGEQCVLQFEKRNVPLRVLVVLKGKRRAAGEARWSAD
jgi:hypothetical protein